jgi:hypothetical protein
MAKVFISYEFKDTVTKPTVDNWRRQGLGTDISFIFIPYIPKQQRIGKKKLRKKIYPEILKADIVLVLVSGDTHSKPWMLYEIRVAQCFRKKLFWCAVNSINPGLPPELKRVKQIKPKLDEVENAIRDFQSEIQKSN